MPSSGVSDGVQTVITEMYPQGIFLPIETSGDGAVNVYSRIQMQLFKARQAARGEVAAALEHHGITEEEFHTYLERHPSLGHSLHHSRHQAGCTAGDVAHEVGRRIGKRNRGSNGKRGISGATGATSEKRFVAHNS
jgi:hypothetical protein